MRKLQILALLIVLVTSAISVNAQEANAAITLERTACNGVCPVYTLTILEDGTVTYNGTEHVAITGEQTSEIPAETVEQIVAAFDEAGYFDWNESYEEVTITDQATVTTSVTRNGETHRIVRYVGDFSAPLALAYLENWVDEVTSSSMWTGVQRDETAISDGTATPIITLQKGACFGPCPRYNVAVYESGTVVFTGIANVHALGVHVIEGDPLAATSVADRAQALGYFGWQDAYDQFLISDQTTVMTSLRWGDEFKRITRYDGDPSAPVGLVWVENMINQLVTDLIGNTL